MTPAMNGWQSSASGLCGFVVLRWLIVAALGLVSCANSFATDPVPPPGAAATTTPHAARQRRIIFDNDGNEPHFLKTLTAEDVLGQRTAALAGSQVDTLFYCTTDSFGITKRPSKVWQLFDSKAGRYERNQTVELAGAGVDVLRVMVEFGHRNGMEVFANIRMNDVHDGSRAEDGVTRFKDNKFKTAHPEYLVGKTDRRPRTGSWAAVNYALPEVREHLLRYVEESCRDYDIDGLHLDFFRHPCFFKTTYLGKPCTNDERAAMSDLMQRIRAMLRDVGDKRGRPLLLSVRVPDSPAYCRDIGLDLERWLREGWVDLLAVTSYFQLNDWADSVALGKKFGVPVYPSLDEPRTKDAAALAARSSLPAYRGRASAAWGAGVDGILLFNFSDPTSPLWRELGDAKSLGRMDKDYFASVRGPSVANGGNLPYAAHRTVETLHPDSPRRIAPGKTAAAKIRLGAMTTDSAKCLLRLRFASSSNPAMLRVEMDGTPLEPRRADDDWVEATLPATTFQLAAPAIHEVRVTLGEGNNSISWLDLMVVERHFDAAIPQSRRDE